MTSITSPDSDLPDNLPLLTQVVATDIPDDLPTLTEIVADSLNVATDAEEMQTAIFAAAENITVAAEPGAEELITEKPAAEPAAEPVEEPVTEHVAAEPAAEKPVAVESGITDIPAAQPRALSDEELQQILHHLETHLDTMLASKFSLHFEKLRAALDAHLDSKVQ
ncbi:MAG: hypothetical protein PHP70_10395 [Gallionella sp.]|nr:hypothetical protein [Gallionella sp.]